MKELDRFRKFLRKDKKTISGGMILSENAPGYDDRKFGKPLPTLESVQAAHEAKVKESEDYLGNFEYQIFGSEYDFKTSQEMGSDPMEIYYDAYLDAGPKDEMIALAKQYADKAPNEKFIVVHEDDWFDEVWSSDAESMDKKERRAGIHEGEADDIRTSLIDQAGTTDGEGLMQIGMALEVPFDYGNYDADDEDDQEALYDDVEKALNSARDEDIIKAHSMLGESVNEVEKEEKKKDKVRAGVRSAAEKLGMKPSHIKEDSFSGAEIDPNVELYSNDGGIGGYVELMDIDDHLEAIHYEWEKWRDGPETEIYDIDPARTEVLQYIGDYLKRSLK